jgi:hypothetical protein
MDGPLILIVASHRDQPAIGVSQAQRLTIRPGRAARFFDSKVDALTNSARIIRRQFCYRQMRQRGVRRDKDVIE